MPIRLTILTKGLLLIAVPLMVQLVLIGLISQTSRREQDADRRYQHTQDVIEQADRVLTWLVDVQTGSRGFVLTENPAFNEPYDRAVRELPKDLDVLQELVSDNPSQRAAVELLANNAAQWLEFQAENVRLVESGAQDEAIARIAALTGKIQMDGLRREIAAFRAAEMRMEDERRQLVESARTSFRWVLVIGTGASLLLAIAIAVAFTRGISRRLATVTANIQSLARAGELAPPVGGGDEIATVDQAFREMAQSLAQSREELTKHTRVLQSMLDNMGDGVVVADEAGKFLVFNRAAERILGVGPTEGGPREWSKQYHVYLPDQTTLFPPEQLPLVRALRGEEVDAAELFVRNPGQSEGTWITVTARPLMDAQGLARGGVAVFQDVTQRKRAEREMQRALRLLDGTRDGTFIFNPETLRFSYVNQGAVEQVGYSRDELLRMTPLDIKPEVDEPQFRQMLVPLLSGTAPSLTFTTIHRHKNGRDVPVEINLQCLADSADTRSLIAIVRDVTERVQAEQERDRFFNLSLDILSIANSDGYFKRINPAFSRILGWSAKEILARPFIDFVHPDDRAATLREVERQVVAGEPVLHFENRYQHKDGSWRVLSWKSVPQPGGLMYATARDVTDAKRAEEALRLNEQNLAITLDSIGDAVMATDPQRRITRMNPVAEQLTGWTRDEALGRPIDKVFHIINERTRQPAVIPVDDVLATGEIHGLANHTALLARDGTERSIADSAAPIRDHAGLIVGAVLVFRDVTEERQTELLHLQFTAIVESSDDAIISKSLEGIITSWNRGAERIFGYSATEAVGQPMAMLFRPGHEDEELQILAQIRRGERVDHLATQRVTKDGRLIDISATISPIQDATGTVIAVSQIARDISAIKRAEKTMVDLKAALDEHAIIAITDARGIITFVNDKFCAISQYSREELIGQDHRIINSGHHPKAFMRDLWETITSGRVWKGEIKNRAKDGTFYWGDNTIVPFLDTDGKPSQYIAIRADITERKRVEEQLVEAREAAESASRAKSEFLASMSHELRTPLNGILGMNELLLNTELTERQRQFVEACSTSGKALLQQINDILDLSKIEAGKLELDVQECNVEAVVYDIADVFSHSTQKKGYPLHCHIDPSACVTALCDGNRLRQILVNLIGNAMKFTKSGAVTVRAECVQQLDRQMTLRFSVTDTGVGIPEDRRDRLFAPFSQVDSSTSREFGGTGLGLSICKQLVELMGGQIGVESQVGVGSTFWFEVPLQLAVEDATVAKSQHVLAGKRVLAVDGIDRERKHIGDNLQAWDCPFEQVATLTEALEAVARAEAAGDPFAVILADCRLAVGDEYVLLQKLAKHSRRPIIGLGTDPDDETIAYLHQLGSRHVLRDPIRPSALFNAMTSVLSVKSPTASPHQTSDATTDQQPTTFSGHILVAEDNHINQMFVRELLKNFGCTCDIAHNGDEALAALQQNRYDLVLMDCQMPEMDGFTASREIRRREATGELPDRLPIIALTANALKGDRERCLDAGMDDYLSKPLQAAQLQTTLAKFLSQPSLAPTPSDEGI